MYNILNNHNILLHGVIHKYNWINNTFASYPIDRLLIKLFDLSSEIVHSFAAAQVTAPHTWEHGAHTL